MDAWAILQSLAILAVAKHRSPGREEDPGPTFSHPFDGGVTFVDKRVLFGPSKTIRGLVVSILATAAIAPIIGVAPEIGALMAAAAMAGDLLSSFVKRRLDRPPSSQATGLDQVPESLLPLLVGRQALSLGAIDITIAVAIFFIGEILLARFFHRLGLREQPY